MLRLGDGDETRFHSVSIDNLEPDFNLFCCSDKLKAVFIVKAENVRQSAVLCTEAKH